MSESYRTVAAERGIDVLSNTEFFEQCKDMDEPDADGVLALTARGGSDAIAITGTSTELAEWLRRAQNALDGGFPIERYVFVEDIATEDEAYGLRDACGMLPGDFGRWNGGRKLLMTGSHVDRAIVWATEHGKPYEVSETRRVDPAAAR